MECGALNIFHTRNLTYKKSSFHMKMTRLSIHFLCVHSDTLYVYCIYNTVVIGHTTHIAFYIKLKLLKIFLSALYICLAFNVVLLQDEWENWWWRMFFLFIFCYWNASVMRWGTEYFIQFFLTRFSAHNNGFIYVMWLSIQIWIWTFNRWDFFISIGWRNLWIPSDTIRSQQQWFFACHLL